MKIGLSYLEIYNEELRDLLVESNSSELHIRDSRDGTFVQNLTSVQVSSPLEVREIMESASTRRVTNNVSIASECFVFNSLIFISFFLYFAASNNSVCSSIYFFISMVTETVSLSLSNH